MSADLPPPEIRRPPFRGFTCPQRQPGAATRGAPCSTGGTPTICQEVISAWALRISVQRVGSTRSTRGAGGGIVGADGQLGARHRRWVRAEAKCSAAGA